MDVFIFLHLLNAKLLSSGRFLAFTVTNCNDPTDYRSSFVEIGNPPIDYVKEHPTWLTSDKGSLKSIISNFRRSDLWKIKTYLVIKVEQSTKKPPGKSMTYFQIVVESRDNMHSLNELFILASGNCIKKSIISSKYWSWNNKQTFLSQNLNIYWFYSSFCGYWLFPEKVNTCKKVKYSRFCIQCVL